MLIYTVIALRALTLLVGCQDKHPACKKIEWWSAGMVICLERGANDLHKGHLMPVPPHHLFVSLKFRMVLPFWCWLTQVVLEKRPLKWYLSVLIYSTTTRLVSETFIVVDMLRRWSWFGRLTRSSGILSPCWSTTRATTRRNVSGQSTYSECSFTACMSWCWPSWSIFTGAVNSSKHLTLFHWLLEAVKVAF